MGLTYLSGLGIRISQSMVDLFNWLTQTSLSDMLDSLAENGVLGWLTSQLLSSIASLLGLFGYSTEQPVIEFFFLCTAGILVIWVIDMLRRFII